LLFKDSFPMRGTRMPQPCEPTDETRTLTASPKSANP
jgi:hypothetical protein